MTGLVVSAHGGRDAGTAQGTLVLPPGVTLYFYTRDTIAMSGGTKAATSGGAYLEHVLLQPNPPEAMVQSMAVETRRPFELVPNYTAFGSFMGDPAFTMQTGLYWVGQSPVTGLGMPLMDGAQMRLSDIIHEGRKVGASSIYWLCCRSAPENATVSDDAGLSADGFSSYTKGSTSGLKPSEVKKTGTWR